MALRVLLLTFLAFHAVLGEDGGYQDMDAAQLEEYMQGLPPEQQEQMRKALAEQTVGGQSAAPKTMTLKKARQMMKTLRTALTGPKARAKFDAIDWPKTGPKSAGRTSQTAPLAGKIAQKVCDKFGVADLDAAVAEAMEAGDGMGQHDKFIRLAMEDIEEVIIGGPSQQRVGRTPRLDELANAFLDADEATRAAALKEARGTEGGEAYVEIMENTLEDEGYVRNQWVRLNSLKQDKSQDQRALFVQLNVLNEFMRLADHKKMKDNYRKKMQESKGEEL